MSKLAPLPPYSNVDEDIFYPSSDGEPMGDNSAQIRWIIALFNGFQGLFRSRDDVLIASNLFWYPVKGVPAIASAPDVMIAFGRPPGDRQSYKQWLEGDIPPQIVFEILSPSNRPPDIAKKYEFYQTYGVEEYYVYDPIENELEAWVRKGNKFEYVNDVRRFASPLLGISFDFTHAEEMKVLNPDGTPFVTYLELIHRHADDLERIELERKRAEQHKKLAEIERTKAEIERTKAEAERAKADALAAKLRELGIDPDTVK